MMIAREKANKITATLKLVVTEEFYDDEASEETLRTYVEQCLEEAGLSVEVGLFKVQEPRVLTLNEANAAMQKDDVIWIEKKGDPVYGGLKKQDYFEMQDDSITDFDDLMEPKIADAYGKVYRLWSSKPTDEQREAVPWGE